MLLERELKTFIRSTLLSGVLKQLPPNSTAPSTVYIKVDLTKTLRQNYAVGVFIIGDYPQFFKLIEESLLEGMTETRILPPAEGVNIQVSLSNCPLPRHNIESVQFLSAAFEQQKGVLVYLKDTRIWRTFQSQTYLSSWLEIWTRQCNCGDEEEQRRRRKQSLLEIVKAKTQDIKDVVQKDPPRCGHCNAKLSLKRMEGKHFRNCQKVTVMLTAREGSKEELFQRGQVDILLDEAHVDRYAEGDVIDLCCYYSCQPRIVKISPSGKIQLKVECGLMLVSSYPSSTLSSHNNLFFSGLQGVSCEYIRCLDPRDEDTVCYNYKNLLKTINMIRFPYLGENTLSTLKLVALNSLFSLTQKTAVHFLVVTDEVALLRQALQVHGVAIRSWPSLYDNPTLIQFLASCHNCILIVTNPTKKDFEYINSILSGNLLPGISFALWAILEPNPDLRKQPALEKFQVVIDLSSEKNFNICRSVYDSMIDQKLEAFLGETNEILMTAPRGKRRPQEVYDYSGENFEGVQSDEREMESQNRTALQLLERYFIRARQYKTITANSLQNIRHIAQGFSFFRAFLRSGPNTPSSLTTKPPINILDAILAIFIEEETSRCKFSSSNTLFSNEISKLMLNEGDCELSFWEYEVDEEQGLGESKRYIPKDEMFKRMVGKLMTLLYDHEII